jgi:hypothetical protein
MPRAAIARSRAPTVFSARIKTIRAENTVMDKIKDSARVLSKIADCVRTASRPCAIGDPRGRGAVRASSSATVRCILRRPSMSASEHCALARAKRVFGTDRNHPYQKHGYG